LSNLLTLQPSTAPRKRARKTTPSKISKFQRPPTLAQLAKAAWTNIPEPSGKLVKRTRKVHRDGYVSRLPSFEWRWSSDPNYFESPRTRAVIEWCDKLVFGPARKMEKKIREDEERLRAQIRLNNLRWRLDAIDGEYDRICKELDTIIKSVMDSYGCHRHRGEWRRRHCSKKKRAEQNQLMKDDFHVAQPNVEQPVRLLPYSSPPNPEYPWDSYFRPTWDRTRPACSSPSAPPNLAPDVTPQVAQPEVAQPVRLCPDSSPTPSPEKDIPVISQPNLSQPVSLSPDSSPAPSTQPAATNSSSPSATPKISRRSRTRSLFTPPAWSDLPHNPPLDPLFARAMDGTTFMVPRPNPPERSDYERGFLPPENPRPPSQRQILKLCEDYFLDGEPPPEPGASWNTKTLLAQLDPFSWTGYAGGYLYALFKNRLLRNERRKKNR
ncbi:MAG: hypothetical protein ACREDR_01465, partial [Blastocatellia bacterium]